MPLSENSPLLNGRGGAEPATFPNISGVLSHLGDNFDRAAIQQICPRNVGDLPKQIAFTLVVLLELKARRVRQKPPSDVWAHWAQTVAKEHEADRLNSYIENTWTEFIDDYRTAHEIEQVLWTPFHVDGDHTVRVVDFLNADCPSQLLNHDLVMFSLANFWKHGPSHDVPPGANSDIARRYDAICTPRILHAVDLATYLAYFSLLVNYVIYPPIFFRARIEYIGAREILLLVFSSSFLLRPWSFFTVPFAITPLMFLSCLPSLPFPGNPAFHVLLLCLAWHVFQFHSPSAPSPLYLFKFEHSLSFASFLVRGFTRIIFPLALFFFPIFVLGAFSLSIALANTFFTDLVSSLSPTPMETRNTILFLFSLLIVAVGCSAFIFAVQGPGLDTSASGWDAYSPTAGRDARTAFIRTVISYAKPATFPAPFNLAYGVLIGAPSFVLRRLGIQLPLFAQGEQIMWRAFVVPVGFVFSLLMFLLP